MRSILDMFLNEAKKDATSIKDAEEQDDNDLNEDEAKNDGDVEEKQDENNGDEKETSPDPIDSDDVEGDKLFSDVDNEADQEDGKTDTDETGNEDDLDNDNSNNDSNGEESDLDDTETDDSDDSTTYGETDETPEDDDLKIKTKKLLTDFVNLHNEVKNMYNDLTNYSTENKVQFLTITRMASNLEELAYSINDYIHIRFNKKSYEENLLMYQKIVDSIKISDEIISKIIENRNNH